MKFTRINSLLLLFALSGLMVFSSCNDDEEDEPKPKPNMNLTASGNSTDANVGDTVDFRIDLTHQVDLQKFTVSSSPTTDADTSVSDIGESGYSYVFEYVIPSGFGAGTSIEFTFTATGEEGESTSKSYTVNVKESGEELNNDNATLLGAQNASKGSLYATSELKRYPLSEFDESNDSKIDFVYYYGATNDATIAAPSDKTVGGGDNAVYDIDWDTRNKTQYLLIEKNWSDIERNTDLEMHRDDIKNLESTKANILEEGDVYAYLTADGRIGAFKVENIEGSQGGEITISVKVEKS